MDCGCQLQDAATGLPRQVGCGIDQDAADAPSTDIIAYHKRGDPGYRVRVMKHRRAVNGDQADSPVVFACNENRVRAGCREQSQPCPNLLDGQAIAKLAKQFLHDQLVSLVRRSDTDHEHSLSTPGSSRGSQSPAFVDLASAGTCPSNEPCRTPRGADRTTPSVGRMPLRMCLAYWNARSSDVAVRPPIRTSGGLRECWDREQTGNPECANGVPRLPRAAEGGRPDDGGCTRRPDARQSPAGSNLPPGNLCPSCRAAAHQQTLARATEQGLQQAWTRTPAP